MATRTFREASEHDYKFWKTKPVPRLGEKSSVDSCQIRNGDFLREKLGKAEETRLPSGYTWRIFDIRTDDISPIVDFLNTNFRKGFIINITADKIKWETMNRGFFVSTVKDDKIVGCLGLTERTIQINSDTKTVAEGIYLCTSDELRSTGLSKVIINETIRRGVLANYDVGSFCTDSIVPSPSATIRYYNRPLNYKHLKENEFVGINDVDDDLAHDRIRIKLKAPRTIYLAEKTDANVKLVLKLYTEYMKTFNLHNVLTLEEVENYFFDDRYVRTIFFEDDNKKVVDFLTYRFYDIHNTNREPEPDKEGSNIIKATNIFAYSSNYHRPDILLINTFKIISREGHHLVYIPDMMESNEVILSSVRKCDEDTDDEEENALYDQHIMKSRKKQFINLFNWKLPLLTQEMVSYLIFN